MVYLFIGQDSFSKDIKLNKLRQDFLPKNIEQFNLDILYAKELTLNSLQEKLLCLPFKVKRRIIVIKDAQDLKAEIKEFILKYVKAPSLKILLILDVNAKDSRDEFLSRLNRYAKVFHFKEAAHLDTFSLSRSIDLKKQDYALRILHQLLKNGEKPERILGGLRYSFEKDLTHSWQSSQRLKLLLDCDLEIKTGRLKPLFALERLVVSLCRLKQSFS